MNMSAVEKIVEKFSDRIWSRVDQESDPDGCWEWTSTRSVQGYGIITYTRLNFMAHRVVWELTNNRAIPDDMVICHKCDNPPCCRPDHLFLGTQADNMADMRAKGRRKAWSVEARREMSRKMKGNKNGQYGRAGKPTA